MSLAIIRSIPLDSKLVPTFLEEIINKKVATVALNIFEELIDWLCSWLYYPYIKLYNDKKARIHTFSDAQTSLVDCTKRAIAKIDFDWNIDYVSLHNVKVLFTPNPNIDIVFSRTVHTEYVVVLDDKTRRPGWYRIIKQDLTLPSNKRPMEISWWVNTNQMHQFEQQGGLLGQTSFFLAEQPNPIPV